MSGGLAALLDDIAAIAKVAAASLDDIGAAAGKASAKAVGVVVDDTAVTPRYVQGFLAHRELPIILKIAKGSLRNKLVFILPVALLLSQFLPWLMTPLLMIGGSYLSFEGAEKVYEVFWGGHHEAATTQEIAELGSPEHERSMVSGAIRTDLILSAEIMAIALAEVTRQPLLSRAVILAMVAVLITTSSPTAHPTTSAPTASTMPTPSWPRMRPSVTAGRSPLRMCRSVPQMVEVVMRTMASPGSSITGCACASQEGLPGPR